MRREKTEPVALTTGPSEIDLARTGLKASVGGTWLEDKLREGGFVEANCGCGEPASGRCANCDELACNRCLTPTSRGAVCDRCVAS